MTQVCLKLNLCEPADNLPDPPADVSVDNPLDLEPVDSPDPVPSPVDPVSDKLPSAVPVKVLDKPPVDDMSMPVDPPDPVPSPVDPVSDKLPTAVPFKVSDKPLDKPPTEPSCAPLPDASTTASATSKS